MPHFKMKSKYLIRLTHILMIYVKQVLFDIWTINQRKISDRDNSAAKPVETGQKKEVD